MPSMAARARQQLETAARFTELSREFGRRATEYKAGYDSFLAGECLPADCDFHFEEGWCAAEEKAIEFCKRFRAAHNDLEVF